MLRILLAIFFSVCAQAKFDIKVDSCDDKGILVTTHYSSALLSPYIKEDFRGMAASMCEMYQGRYLIMCFYHEKKVSKAEDKHWCPYLDDSKATVHINKCQGQLVGETTLGKAKKIWPGSVSKIFCDNLSGNILVLCHPNSEPISQFGPYTCPRKFSDRVTWRLNSCRGKTVRAGTLKKLGSLWKSHVTDNICEKNYAKKLYFCDQSNKEIKKYNTIECPVDPARPLDVRVGNCKGPTIYTYDREGISNLWLADKTPYKCKDYPGKTILVCDYTNKPDREFTMMVCP